MIDERTLNDAINHISERLKAAEFLDSIANKAEMRGWLRAEQHDQWLGFNRANIARWFQDAELLAVLSAF